MLFPAKVGGEECALACGIYGSSVVGAKKGLRSSPFVQSQNNLGLAISVWIIAGLKCRNTALLHVFIQFALWSGVKVLSGRLPYSRACRFTICGLAETLKQVKRGTKFCEPFVLGIALRTTAFPLCVFVLKRNGNIRQDENHALFRNLSEYDFSSQEEIQTLLMLFFNEVGRH